MAYLIKYSAMKIMIPNCMFIGLRMVNITELSMQVSGPEIIKLSCSTQLSSEFILFINIRMPTIVCLRDIKQKTSSFVGIFGFYEQKFHGQLS